jgi:hypothetical protein
MADGIGQHVPTLSFSTSTMATRPRQSILDAFDPLSSTSSTTDTSHKSGLELLPPSLFNGGLRQPTGLKRRLIDVGDETMDNGGLQTVVEADECPAHLLHQNQETSSDSNATRRLEGMGNASPRRRDRKRRCLNDSSQASSTTKKTSALSSIIDAVHSAGVSFAAPPERPPSLADLIGNGMFASIPSFKQNSIATASNPATHDHFSTKLNTSAQVRGSSAVHQPPLQSLPLPELATFYAQIQPPEMSWSMYDDVSFSPQKVVESMGSEDTTTGTSSCKLAYCSSSECFQVPN